MPRQTFSWTMEKSKMRGDRAQRQALTFTWREDVNSFGDTVWFGYDADGRHQGSVALIDRKLVGRAFQPGTMDSIRLGEFPMSPIGMRLAKEAVETFISTALEDAA
jgi:hypothetical protein